MKYENEKTPRRSKNNLSKGASGKKNPDIPFNGKIIPKRDRIVGYTCNDQGAQIPAPDPINFWGKRLTKH